MRNDAPADYSRECSSLGVRWLGVPVPGGIPTKHVIAEGNTTRTYSTYEKRSDYHLARVNASEVVRFLQMEASGEWRAALREFRADVLTRLYPDMPDIEGADAFAQRIITTVECNNATFVGRAAVEASRLRVGCGRYVG